MAIKTKKNKKQGQFAVKESPYVLDLRQISVQRQEEEAYEAYAKEKQELQEKLSFLEMPEEEVEHKEEHSEPPIVEKPTPMQDYRQMLADMKTSQTISSYALSEQEPVTRLSQPVSSEMTMQYFHPLHDFMVDTRRMIRYAKVHLFPNYQPTLAAVKAKRRNASLKRLSAHALIIFIVLVGPLLSIRYFNSLVNRQEVVKSQALSAFVSLQEAKEAVSSFDVGQAITHLQGAQNQLHAATQGVGDIHPMLSTVISYVPHYGPKYITAKALLKGSEQLTQAAHFVALGVQEMQSTSEEPLTNKLERAISSFTLASEQLEGASVNFKEVDLSYVPTEQRPTAQKVLAILPEMESGLSKQLDYSNTLLELMGHDSFKRYLVIFQNSNEIRPTGGFMGSFALLDVDRGKIKNLEIPKGGTYDVKGGLTTLLQTPDELRLVNSAWQMQDANWFFDFPESAEKIRWFYEKSGGPTVDGVIVITSKAARELVGYFGDVYLSEHNKVVTKENFEYLLQRAIDFEEENQPSQPKAIVHDLVFELVEKLFDLKPKQYVDVAQILINQLDEKQMMIHLRHPRANEYVSSLNWAGEMKPYSMDYLAVVHTNIGGGKTDGVIDNKVDVLTTINENGEVFNEVTITRAHHGRPNDIFTGVKNVNYVRVYTPQGSELIEATGFERPPEGLFLAAQDTYDQDEDLMRIEGDYLLDEQSQTKIISHPKATVFGNWMMTDVGQTSQAVLRYKLPFTVDFHLQEDETLSSSYTHYFQKQAGIESYDYNMTLKLPENHGILWQHPDNWILLEGNKLHYHGDVKKDQMLGVVLNKSYEQ